MSGLVTTGTVNIVGTGGILEGDLDDANVNVNLDKSLMFDGTNDYINCGTDTDHDFTDHFTLACWAKNDNATTTGGDREHLIAKYAGSNDHRLFRLYLHGSTLRFGCGYNSGNSSIEITHSMTGLMDHWNHYAATFDGGVMKLYVNGVLVTNTDNSGTLTAIHSKNTRALNLGAYEDGGHTWTGQMADARIYNAVLTDANIQVLASKINTDSSLGAGTTNLKGYWKLNNETASGGGSGTGYVVDESGTVNQGTLTNFSGTYWDYDAYSVDVYDNSTTTDGTFTVTQGKVEGIGLTSLELAGTSNTGIDLNNALTSTLEDSYTWSMWVNLDELHGSSDVLLGGTDGSGNDGIIWNINSSGNYGYYVSISGTEYANNLNYFSAGASGWMNLAVTVTKDSASAFTIKKYKDGELVQTTTHSANLEDYNGATDIFIGTYNLGGFTRILTLDGKIKEVKLFDYALSQEQISSLYSNTYPQTPKYYWKIEEGTGTAIEDYGTATDVDGTLTGGSWSNGTLDLDGQFETEANGTFSAPRGKVQIAGNFEPAGTWIHNNGTLETNNTSEKDFNVDASTALYNWIHDGTTLTIENATDGHIVIENALTINSGKNLKFQDGADMTFGTSSQACTVTNNGNFENRNANNTVTLKGASSLYPFAYEGTDINWDQDASSGNVQNFILSNCNWNPDITTGEYVNIQLAGDCEFDALTLSANSSFDVNGQRVEFGGNVTYSGTLDADGLLVFHGGFTKYGTLNNAASGDIMAVGTSGHPTFSYITGYRTFFANGGVQLGTGGFTNVSKAIVASGELRTGTRDTSCSDFTIARGGTFDADDNTHTVSGNFRNGGGLYGDNCLELNGSDEYAKSATFTDARSSSNNGDYTIEFWFKKSTTAVSAREFIFDYSTGSNNLNRSMGRLNSSEQLQWLTYTAGGGEHPNLTGNTSGLNDGKWHHAAYVFYGSGGAHTGTYPNGAKAIYLDGKLDAFVEGGFGGATHCNFDVGTNMTLTVGRDENDDDDYFDGNVSDLRIFSDVRTEAEIRADMFNGDFVPITKTASYNNDPTITLSSAAYDIVVGMSVSGTGIPAGAYVASITSSTVFELSASTTGGSLSGQTLTFTGLKDRGNLVASYPFTEGSGSAVDNVETTSARDLVLYDAGGAETSALWVPIGSGGVFTRDGSTVSITGKTSKVTVAHNTTFHGLSVAASGGSTWVTSPQGAGYDFYIAGPFTCNGGVLQPNSGSRFDFANNGYDIVYNGTDLGTTSVLTMNSSGTIFFPYKDGTSTAQNYGGFSIRGPAALSGDAVINGSFDFGGSNETFNTRGFDISLNSSSSLINSGHTFIADAGTTITMGHSNGWINSAGTMKLWGENAAVFPEPQNNTLTRANAAALQFGTGDFSISFWYKSDDSWDREHQILGNANFYLHLNNAGASAEKLRAYMGDAYVDTGAFNSARLGQNWNHFVVTFDRSDLLKVYVNGSYEANVDISGKSGQDIMNSGTLTIGETNATSGRGWHGSLADMRFFKGTVLTDGGVSVGQAATGNVASLYNSGLNPATHISSDGDGGYYASDSPTATTWWKLGNTNASGARTTAPALDLTDSSSGSLTLTNTGGVKAGSIFMTKSSGSYSITDSNDTLIMYWRNCKINMNGNTELYVSSASQFSGRITLD